MDKQIIFSVIGSFLFSAFVISCGMLESGREILVALPPVLPAYRSCFESWEVEIFYEDGREERRLYSGMKTDFLLATEREELVCLLCRGILDGGFLLKPAGALSSAGTGGELALVYEYGPAVETLAFLRASGYDLKQFNARRFLEETARRCTRSPWQWDRTAWSEAVAGGEFNLWDLKEGELFPVPADWSRGPWLSEDPFLGVVPETGCSLPGGFHRFFSLSGDFRRDVSINKDGTVLSIDYLASLSLD